MAKIDSSQNRARSISDLQQRIAYCVRVARITFCLAGIILTGVQVVKFFTDAPEDRGLASLSIGFALGITLLILCLPPLLERAVAWLAARIRSRNLAILIYVLGLALTAMFVSLKIVLDPESWRLISTEGGVSEYGTAIAYLLLTFFAYPISRQFWRQNQKIMGVLYGILAFLGFFVGMEEISWGQRLIGFEEPEFWAKHNAQSEFTFHNLSYYQTNILDQSYIAIGLIGSLGWILLRYWERKPQHRIDPSYILPSWSVSSFFYANLIFYTIFLNTDGFGFFVAHDQEHSEFIMSLGVLLFVIINFLRQAKEGKLAASKTS